MHLVYLHTNYIYAMNNKSLLTSTLIAALSLSSFPLNASTPSTPPPARVPGLDLIKPEPRIDGNRFGNVDLSSDLLAHYSFDGHTNDSSGNQNHATSNGV